MQDYSGEGSQELSVSEIVVKGDTEETTADKVYAHTDHINWYLENRDASQYQITDARELQGLSELVNGTARDAEDFDEVNITLKNDLSSDNQEWILLVM